MEHHKDEMVQAGRALHRLGAEVSKLNVVAHKRPGRPRKHGMKCL